MTSSTLTDRYVAEVVRHIPADQRKDVAAELHGTITDMVQARDSDEPIAEREVLTELGDPIRLAAGYADRPMALIGPRFYPAFARLMRMLFTVVLPIVVLVMVGIDVVENNSLGSAIGTAVVTVITVGAQLVAWPTVIFTFLDRVVPRSGPDAPKEQWTPDQLPDPSTPDDGRGNAIVCAVWNGLLLLLVLWQQFASPYRPGGEGDPVPLIDPDLWSGWIWPIVLGFAALVATYLARLVTRRWTAVLNGLVVTGELVVGLALAWTLQQRMFLNPEFLSTVNDGKGWTVPDEFYTVTVLGVLVVTGWAIIDHFRMLRRG